jgi:XisI protein
MDRIENYRQYIRNLLIEQATLENANSDVECQLIFDKEHDHYQLLDVGWQEMKRIYNCFIHLDIKNGKIWIQRNMTELDIAQTLEKMGVQKEDIILGLHPPDKRPYTGCGVA